MLELQLSIRGYSEKLEIVEFIIDFLLKYIPSKAIAVYSHESPCTLSLLKIYFTEAEKEFFQIISKTIVYGLNSTHSILQNKKIYKK